MHKTIRNRFLLFLAVGLPVALAGYLIFGSSGLLHVRYLKEQNDTLVHQVQQLKAENEGLSEQIRRLENDPDYLEKVIRDRLNLIKPDETLILFKTAPSTQSGYQ